MDIYTYAMQMEKHGRKYYLDMAQKTTNPGFKSILKMMADAEAKHYNILLAMQRNEKAEFEADTEIFTETKNVFMKMKEEKVIDVDVSQVELYKKALEIETNSKKFYLERANEETDPHRKEIFLVLAKEEKAHCILLENLVNLVSQPDSWIENSEWYDIDEV